MLPDELNWHHVPNSQIEMFLREYIFNGHWIVQQTERVKRSMHVQADVSRV